VRQVCADDPAGDGDGRVQSGADGLAGVGQVII
jgi:hypothetical protein